MGRATFSGNVNPWASFPDYMDYRDRSQSLQTLATIGGGASPVTVTGGDEPVQVPMTFVTANIFEALGTPPRLGRTFTIEELPGDGAGQVVISHGFWQRWFGGADDVLGKSLLIDGSPVTVMGVMPEGFRFMYDVDLWAPPWPGNSDPTTRRYHNWLMVGRLKPDATLEGAAAEFEVISTQLEEAYPDSNRRKAARIDGLQDVLVEGFRQSLVILMGAILILLLIACSNVASLLMARASTRGSEMAVRASLGAGRLRLTRQLLVECVVLALGAGVLGIVLAMWLQDLIVSFVSMRSIGITDVDLSPSMLFVALALSLGTVVLFGLFPSFSAARANPAQDLRDGSKGSAGRGGIRVRSGLVILQVALSLVLLVGSGLLLRSFARLSGVDPGFRVENLLTATLALPRDDYQDLEQRIQFFEGLRESVEALPGVEDVAMVNQLPILQPSGNVAIWAPERPPETNNDAPWADRRIVLPGYFRTMEIPLVDGRYLEETDDAEAPQVIVLSRRTAELVFPDERAVGRQVGVDMGGAEPGYFQVVGVVEDHQTSSLARSPRPAMFFSYAQRPWEVMRMAVATDNEPMDLFRPIQERVWERDPDIVLSNPQTMEDAVAESIAGSRSMAAVMGMFSLVALALAALGIYGVLAFFVARRVHEIGIRVALGASGGKVMGLVITRGMILVGVGSVLGIAGAIGATRLVADMLFQTEATDIGTYAGVTGGFLILALAACVIPAWRALKVDPVVAFRSE
jgi:putative ABC transport system permease protein